MKNERLSETGSHARVLKVRRVKVRSGKSAVDSFDHTAKAFLERSGFVHLRVDPLDKGHIRADVPEGKEVLLEYSVRPGMQAGPFRVYILDRDTERDIDTGLTSYIQAEASGETVEIDGFGGEIGNWEFHCIAPSSA